jgi:molecular chaperone GrpE (heat shock protein)
MAPDTTESCERQSQNGQASPLAVILPGFLEALASMDLEARSQRSKLEQKVDSLGAAVEHLNGTLQQLPTCLASVTEQQQRMTDHHYDEHIIIPLARHLLQIHNYAADALDHWQVSALECGDDVVKLLVAIRSQVTELLACYHVESLSAPDGSPFDPVTMQALNTLPAGLPALGVWVVDKTVRIGFRHGLRVLRPQYVDVRVKTLQQGVLLLGI